MRKHRKSAKEIADLPQEERNKYDIIICDDGYLVFEGDKPPYKYKEAPQWTILNFLFSAGVEAGIPFVTMDEALEKIGVTCETD